MSVPRPLVEALDARRLLSSGPFGVLEGRETLVGTGGRGGVTVYAFDLPVASKLDAVLDRAAAGATLSLLQDANGNGRADKGETLAIANTDAGTAKLRQTLSSGAYFFRVDAPIGTPFALGLTADTDVNGARDLGTIGTQGLSVGEHVGARDPSDLFHFDVANPGTIKYDITAPTGTLVELWRDADADGLLDNGEKVTDYTVSSFTGRQNIAVAAVSGSYFIRVVRVPESRSANYTLSVAYSPRAVNAAGLLASAFTSSDGSTGHLLRLPGIAGESTLAGFAGQIKVHSLSWDLQNNMNVTTSGVTAGKPVLNNFSFWRDRVDIASPLIAQAVSQGKLFAEAEINIFSATQIPTPVVTIKLATVAITSYAQSFPGTGFSEGFRLKAAKLDLSVVQINAAGAKVGTVVGNLIFP